MTLTHKILTSIPDRWVRRSFLYLIRMQKERVIRLEETLKRARKMLHMSEEAYIRAYVSKYWRGKGFDTSIEELEQFRKEQEEVMK